ncbi:MAG: SO_0444 family Cu/Zn efflux transporter [Phycisphaerae bacterium]
MSTILFNILSEMWSVLGEMAIYLLFGFLVAGILSVLISPETVERHLGGKGIWPIIKATLFGVPLPLCSCGVIPVAMALRKHGATRGATTSFLLSTPQTGVDSILVTYSLLGIVFAIFRPVVAIVTGLIGGTIVEFFDRKNSNNELPVNVRCEDACCSVELRQKHGKIYRMLEHGFVTLPKDIAVHLLIGLLVAGLISALVPPHYFSNSFLGGGIGAMLAMMLLGIPTYVCASASVPMAMALIAKGVSPGAALVFLITGPASNAASLVTVWKIMGKRTAIIYLATVAGTSLLAGMTLDYIFTYKSLPMASHVGSHDMLPEYIKTIAAVTLLVILIAPLVYDYLSTRREFKIDRRQGEVILKVTGMTCTECAKTVREALLTCRGVNDVKVNLHSGQVHIQGEKTDMEALRIAVKSAGFGIDEPRP